eukprot:COSAG06_NODE_53881_length_297_cov_1.272727_1_plen_93_part_10
MTLADSGGGRCTEMEAACETESGDEHEGAKSCRVSSGMLWTAAEDAQLKQMVQERSDLTWKDMSDQFDTERSRGSLSARWLKIERGAPHADTS